MAEIITCPSCCTETITVNASSSECISLSSSSKQLCQDSKGTRDSILPLIWSWVRNFAWNESRNSINRNLDDSVKLQRGRYLTIVSAVVTKQPAVSAQENWSTLWKMRNVTGADGGCWLGQPGSSLGVYVWKHIYLISHMLHIRAAESLLHTLFTSDPRDQGQRWTVNTGGLLNA